MACGLSNSLGFSSSSLKKQGIVTILGGECDSDISSNTSAASLRRTFSADLSSKNLVSGNAFYPMTKIASSQELCASGADSLTSSNEETKGGGGGGEGESRSGFDIWAQIQEEKKKKKINEDNPCKSGVWSSILSQKSEPITSIPPPYVHPLVKRSSSSLTEKSLEVCTESLGSETGSDGFSLFPSSEIVSAEDHGERQKMAVEAKEGKGEEAEVEQETWFETFRNNTTVCSKSSRRGSFPPPIPSLSSHSGKSMTMKTCRNNGRLVLQAVSMPSQNNFSSKRQNGRLVLTFAQNNNNPKEEEKNLEDLWFNEEEEEEETESGLMGIVAQKPNGFMSVHRLAHKTIGLLNRNPKRLIKEEHELPIAQSLPPRPRVAQLVRAVQPPSTVDDTVGAACFNNTYDYYWRPNNPISDTKPIIPNTTTQNSIKKTSAIGGGGGGGGGGHDAWLNGCKEQRRSLLFFEPFCIAT